MRYGPKQYAGALFSVLTDKSVAERKKILQNFVRLISKRGELKNLGLIIKEIEKQYLATSGFKKISLEAADRVTAELKKEVRTILGERSLILEKINPRLLAGIKILVNDELLVDASAKSQLKRLFRSS